jgi:mono/diheme cytochrome c family protein
MKTVFAILLAAGFAMASGPSIAAGDSKGGVTKASTRTGGSGSVKPHFAPTGKPATAARGEQIFLDHCALCHGLHGKGDGPRSAYFQPGVQYIPDLTVAGFLKGRDDQLLASIGEGLHRLPEPAYVMPQFKYILSDEEIRSVLAYVKTLPAQAAKKQQ